MQALRLGRRQSLSFKPCGVLRRFPSFPTELRQTMVSFRWWDVLIEPEQVGRVLFLLQVAEAFPLCRAECRLDAAHALVAEKVEIGAAA